ncbi:butyrophilin subfamily 3 member A2-like [Engraulis encrasicolus]|uniref:butyrophilin subfamily 3 member A2-like n=1 Tax=Engraulis encrasicolus TaxID=184585 RepID=UPI002FD15C45
MMIWLLITSTLLGTAGAVSGITGPDGPVVGLVGDDLQLPCHVKSGVNAVDEEIIWKRGDKMVHHYLRHTDRTEQQPPEYRGRTSVSRKGLQTGDASFTLTNVSLSDAGECTCRVRADTWYDDAEVTVKVEAKVSRPSVSVVSLGDGRVRLQCESEGWSTEPQVYWLDSRGQQIAADPTSFRRLPSGLRVTSNITVEERQGYNFTCVMNSAAQWREQTVEVPREYPHCGSFYTL